MTRPHKIQLDQLGQKEKIKKASSSKLQAALTMDLGSCRMELERNIMEYATKELERIADALEEILRLVKKDMAEMKKAAK